MRIGIDISPIIYGTGVSVYTKNLVENLLKIDTKNEYVLFGFSFRRKKELEQYFKKTKAFYLPPKLMDILWNRIHVLPVETFTGHLDVYHSSDWTQGPSWAYKVTTIHDLSPLKFPEYTDPLVVSQTKSRLTWIKKEVDKIIVPSESTKKDCVEIGIDEKKLVVIPESLKPGFGYTDNKPDINGPYFLAVGANMRKNNELIVQALNTKRQELSKYKLVIVGKGTSTENVIYKPGVSDEELMRLYSHATALIYPSMYEGFGLPILEAFACSVPVICSNTSSLPEVGANAVVYVDPQKTEDLAKAMLSIIDGSIDKVSLVKKGIDRLKLYSWEKTAKLTQEVYASSN